MMRNLFLKSTLIVMRKRGRKKKVTRLGVSCLAVWGFLQDAITNRV
jgi:hypothetical protein